MGASLNPSYRLRLNLRRLNLLDLRRLNLLAKIGLLWYEKNDFSNANKPTALERCQSLTDRRRSVRFGKNNASGILLPNAPTGIGQSRVCSDEFPVRSHEFPVPAENRESCASTGIAAQIDWEATEH
jgi:hypothetical protein